MFADFRLGELYAEYCLSNLDQFVYASSIIPNIPYGWTEAKKIVYTHGSVTMVSVYVYISP